MEIKKELWAKCGKCEKEIYRYTITNKSGASVQLCSIGAGIVSINVPDREGKLGDVVLGYENPMDYFGDGPCMGRCPGRFANRIAKGHFCLDGKEYSLPINNACNHLHGGPDGFQNKVWESRTDGNAVEFLYDAADMEAGYPGNLKVVVRYDWGEDCALRITFMAQTDAPTILNLTNHAYFNLDGEGEGTIKDHILTINGSEYLPTDETLIPLGDSEPVAGTPLDFINPKPIGRDLLSDFPAQKYAKGYDSSFLIDGAQKGQLQMAGTLFSPKSGRVMEIVTTQPDVHVYTGNWLNGCPKGKNGHIYDDYSGVAIECQHFPDSPNKPEYPTTVLRPGETFEEAVIYAFSVKE